MVNQRLRIVYQYVLGFNPHDLAGAIAILSIPSQEVKCGVFGDCKCSDENPAEFVIFDSYTFSFKVGGVVQRKVDDCSDFEIIPASPVFVPLHYTRGEECLGNVRAPVEYIGADNISWLTESPVPERELWNCLQILVQIGEEAHIVEPEFRLEIP